MSKNFGYFAATSAYRITVSAGFLKLVGLDRIELSTSPLSGVRSSQLSYRPFLVGGRKLVELVGIEPATS